MSDELKPDDEKPPKNSENLLNFAKTNTAETVVYILLIVGLVLMLFGSPLGTILVGGVVGYFFSDEIAHSLRSYNDYVHKHGVVKALIIGGLFLAIFIALPLMVISAAVVIGFKQLLFPPK